MISSAEPKWEALAEGLCFRTPLRIDSVRVPLSLSAPPLPSLRRLRHHRLRHCRHLRHFRPIHRRHIPPPLSTTSVTISILSVQCRPRLLRRRPLLRSWRRRHPTTKTRTLAGVVLCFHSGLRPNIATATRHRCSFSTNQGSRAAAQPWISIMETSH